MALGVGRTSRIGIGLESLAGTYGTLVAPTILIPALSEGLAHDLTMQQDEALTDCIGQKTPVVTGKKVAGALKIYAGYRTSEYLILCAMAGADTKTGAASPYTHTIALGDTWTRRMSVIIEKDVSCWEIAGAKINNFSLNASPSGVFWDMDIIAKTTTIGTTHRAALDALTFTESDPRVFFHQLNGGFRIGDTADALGTVDKLDVSSIVLNYNSNLVVDERTSGSGLFITNPVRNAQPEITLNLTMPRLEATTLIDAYLARTKLQADIIFTGDAVGAGNYKMTINIPTCFITAMPTNIEGQGLISVPITLQCVRNDGNANMTCTAPFEIILMNAGDTALAWAA